MAISDLARRDEESFKRGFGGKLPPEFDAMGFRFRFTDGSLDIEAPTVEFLPGHSQRTATLTVTYRGFVAPKEDE